MFNCPVIQYTFQQLEPDNPAPFCIFPINLISINLISSVIKLDSTSDRRAVYWSHVVSVHFLVLIISRKQHWKLDSQQIYFLNLIKRIDLQRTKNLIICPQETFSPRKVISIFECSYNSTDTFKVFSGKYSCLLC